MYISSISDKGLIRENNQDYFFISENKSIPLFIIADGMGGHKAGEIASKMAVDIISEEFFSHMGKIDSEEAIISRIKSSIYKANHEIYEKAESIEDCEGMGTTVTLAFIYKGQVFIGHVGDSRCYIISDNKIVQITEDHSLVNELIKNGTITKEEGMKHPQKNYITRAIGTDKNIEIDIYKREYKEEDILILSTDGLTNMIDEDTILSEIIINDDITKSSKTLVDKAKEFGGLDNITIITIKL